MPEFLPVYLDAINAAHSQTHALVVSSASKDSRDLFVQAVRYVAEMYVAERMQWVTVSDRSRTLRFANGTVVEFGTVSGPGSVTRLGCNFCRVTLWQPDRFDPRAEVGRLRLRLRCNSDTFDVGEHCEPYWEEAFQ